MYCGTDFSEFLFFTGAPSPHLELPWPTQVVVNLTTNNNHNNNDKNNT